MCSSRKTKNFTTEINSISSFVEATRYAITKMSRKISRKFASSKNNDVFGLKFLFFIFKILGIFTISYNDVWIFETNSRNLVFKFSRFGIFYNIIFIFFLLYINVIDYYSDPSVTTTKQETIVYNIALCLRHFTTTLILIVFIFQQARMVSIANKIYKLKARPVKVSFKEKCLFSIYVVKFIILYVVLNILNYFTYNVVSAHLTNVYIIYFFLIQYTSILKIIKKLYEFINDSLQDLLLKHFCWAFENCKLDLKIDKLMNLHSRLYELSIELSGFYSLPMIFATFHIYIYLLSRAYFYIKWSFESSSYVKTWKIFLEIYLTILSLAILVIDVTNTIKEVNIL